MASILQENIHILGTVIASINDKINVSKDNGLWVLSAVGTMPVYPHRQGHILLLHS